MADNITVTFGGREVLKQRAVECFEWFETEHLSVSRTLHTRWMAEFRLLWCGLKESSFGESPQAAASAVESKLRQLRDELDKVLGGK